MAPGVPAIIVAGTFRLPPDNVARAMEAMATVVTASRAEDGCLAYNYAADPFESGLFHVFEAWTSREALTAHFATAHMAAWQEARSALGFHDRDITLYPVGAAEPL